jgi:hypothetical protein
MQCLNQLCLKSKIWHETLKSMETAKTTKTWKSRCDARRTRNQVLVMSESVQRYEIWEQTTCSHLTYSRSLLVAHKLKSLASQKLQKVIPKHMCILKYLTNKFAYLRNYGYENSWT